MTLAEAQVLINRPEPKLPPLAPSTPSSPRSPIVQSPQICGFQEVDLRSPDVVPAERPDKVAIPMSSAPSMQPSRRHSIAAPTQAVSASCTRPKAMPVAVRLDNASASRTPSRAVRLSALDDSSWAQSPVQPPSPGQRPSTTKAWNAQSCYAFTGWPFVARVGNPSASQPQHAATPSRCSSWARSRSVPSSHKREEHELPSLLEAVGGFYKELLQGTRCTIPDSVVIHDRSVEIDLSHEFPPERREAQIDPQDNFNHIHRFHRTPRLAYLGAASMPPPNELVYSL